MDFKQSVLALKRVLENKNLPANFTIEVPVYSHSQAEAIVKGCLSDNIYAFSLPPFASLGNVYTVQLFGVTVKLIYKNRRVDQRSTRDGGRRFEDKVKAVAVNYVDGNFAKYKDYKNMKPSPFKDYL